MSLCEKCTSRELKAMRALESLTPGGSEFVNEPERCVAFVRDRLSYTINSVKKRRDLTTALCNIGNAIGAPTMDYADPEFQLKQVHKRLQEISQIVQEALGA
jgi:hypothetical protein